MTTSERVYRDIPTPLYSELVLHAEHRGMTVPALLEGLARTLAGRYHPDGTKRDTPLSFPRLPAFTIPEIPVIDSRSGMARPRRTPRNIPKGGRAHRLDIPTERARFEEAVRTGHRNSELAAMFGVSTQTIAGWRERCGLPAAGSREGRDYRATAEHADRAAS
jgi:hypothetical protein